MVIESFLYFTRAARVAARMCSRVRWAIGNGKWSANPAFSQTSLETSKRA